VTATLLGVVLVRFADAFGVPERVFAGLAGIVLVYCVYSSIMVLLNPSRWRLTVRVIAVANALYCGVTLIMLVVLRDRVTALGVAYFVGEAALILGIAAFEWRYASRRGAP